MQGWPRRAEALKRAWRRVSDAVLILLRTAPHQGPAGPGHRAHQSTACDHAGHAPKLTGALFKERTRRAGTRLLFSRSCHKRKEATAERVSRAPGGERGGLASGGKDGPGWGVSARAGRRPSCPRGGAMKRFDCFSRPHLFIVRLG